MSIKIYNVLFPVSLVLVLVLVLVLCAVSFLSFVCQYLGWVLSSRLIRDAEMLIFIHRLAFFISPFACSVEYLGWLLFFIYIHVDSNGR